MTYIGDIKIDKMNYKSRSTTFCLLIILFWSPQLKAQNIISNASFEFGIGDWDTGTWGGGGAAFTQKEGVASEGTSSMEISVTNSAPDEVHKVFVRKSNLSVIQGDAYQVSFDIMSESGAEEKLAATLYSHPNIGGAAWGTAWTKNSINFQGDGEWKSFSFSFQAQVADGVPDFDALGLMFGFGFSTGVYYLDNISLQKVDDGGESNDDPKAYYISKTGDDNNAGTENEPFLTIAKAGAIARAGDTVMIGAGIYRETVSPVFSGTASQPILYRAKAGEEVLISGMEPLMDWELDQGPIYKTTVNWSLGDENMVFYEEQLCDLARWPDNTDHDPFTIEARTDGTGSLNHLTGPMPNRDWANGGIIWYLGKSRWTSWRAHITASTQNRIEFTGPSGWEGSAHDPGNGGEYILYGIKEALDYPYEFYVDANAQTLFLQTPNGTMPAAGQVEMKKRMLGFDLTNISHTIVDGIDFHGCSIEIVGAATGNIIRNAKVTWGNHTIGAGTAAVVQQQSINLRGSNNLVERSEVAWGASSGIWVAGAGNTVKDCRIHDFDYLGSYGSPIQVRNGSNSTIIQNTVYNAGRDVIQSVSNQVEIAYNDIFNSNLINDDCGPFYTCCGEHYGSIHHNFIHDSYSRGDHYKAAGIYLDNSSQYWEVHHNIIVNMEWTAIQMNWDDWFINIYNNSIWNVDKTIGTWLPTGTSLKEVHVFNNLTNDGNWDGTNIEQNLVLSESPFIDKEAFDFRLQDGHQAIDFGRTVAGIDIPYSGSAPDAGAIEKGLDVFAPGVTWLDNVFPGVTSFEEIKENQLKLFPNPATDYFQLEGKELAGAALYLFDYAGKQVLFLPQLARSASIQIGHLPSGVYFVYLKEGTQLTSGRFVKL